MSCELILSEEPKCTKALQHVNTTSHLHHASQCTNQSTTDAEKCSPLSESMSSECWMHPPCSPQFVLPPPRLDCWTPRPRSTSCQVDINHVAIAFASKDDCHGNAIPRTLLLQRRPNDLALKPYNGITCCQNDTDFDNKEEEEEEDEEEMITFV